MKMINGVHLNLVLNIIIATGHHIDVLLALWLLFVQSLHDKELHGTTKVWLALANLLGRYRQFCTVPGACSQTP